MDKMERLKSQLKIMARYGAALGLLGWDEEVNMPPKAQAYRGEVNAQLATDLHKKFTSKEFVRLVKELHEPSNYEKLSEDDKINVRETWRDLEKATKVPSEFVEEMAKLTSQAFSVWVEARKQSDFKLYQPVLEKIVGMKKKEVELVGYKDSPYDALLDDYEPGLTAKKVEELFTPLSKSLAALIGQIKGRPMPRLPEGNYPIPIQKQLNEEIARMLGYDLAAGRLDESAHPFTTGFGPRDVRITTRYDEKDFWGGIGSTIHETGHALYEQGLPEEHFGTPVGETVSLGIHESQSRLWENLVGRSREFSTTLNTLLVKYFGESAIKFSPEELYLWLNRIQPGFIRVEADEVTYNLHIVLRFEIEKALMEGEIKVADLPAIWNEKMKKYLGVDVPDDAQGVLQDVHWSHGLIGYFPTYCLGNIYAAQLFNKAEADIPDLKKKFEKGEFDDLLKWLRKNIHQAGGHYHAQELIKKVTGEGLNSAHLIKHLEDRVNLFKV